MPGDQPTVTLMARPPIEVEGIPVGDRYDYRTGSRPEQGSLRWHVRALRAHGWLAAAVLLIAVAGAQWYAVAAAPVYVTHLKLLIEPEAPKVVTFEEVVDQHTSKVDYYETQLGILRSRSLARKTLDALSLWNAPEFGAASGSNWTARLRPAASTVAVPDESAAQSRAIDAFLASVAVKYRPDNRLVDIGVASPDARRAADIANTLAAVYIEDQLATTLLASRQASEWLQARVSEQLARVEASELALQLYRERHADVPLAGQETVVAQKLADLNAAVTRVRTARIEAEARHAQLRAIQGDPAGFDTLPAIQSNEYIQKLKAELAALEREETAKGQRLGDRHPEMLTLRSAIDRTQAQIHSEVAKVAEAALNQQKALQIEEQTLAAALESQKQHALGVSRKGIEYAALERDATSNRQILERLLQRAQEVDLASELSATNARIVDPAEVSQQPAFPRKGLIALLSLLVGLPLAIGVAFAREYLDDRIKSPEQITADLGLRFLGCAPVVPRSLAAGVPLVDERRVPAFAEALRAVRANLLLAAPVDTAHHLLVTSTGSNEGKTLVASNLAVTLARAGRRVLLVDADMRRARLHASFGLPLDPGLAGVLQGTLNIADAIQATAIPGLSLVTAGTSISEPGDLLEQDVFANAIAAVRDRFDWIVIDSPPVMAAADAITLAHTAMAVIFVVGSHMIKTREARAALEQLSVTGAKVIGAVLSRSSDDGHSAYSYRRYRAYYRH